MSAKEGKSSRNGLYPRLIKRLEPGLIPLIEKGPPSQKRHGIEKDTAQKPTSKGFRAVKRLISDKWTVAS